MMLESICKPNQKEEEEFDLLKININNQMKDLKNNSIEILTDLFKE